MKRTLLAALTALVTCTAFADMPMVDKTLICRLGGAENVDIKLEWPPRQLEKVTVVFYEIDGETVQRFSNVELPTGTYSNLKTTPLRTIVFKDGEKDMFGGAYLDAGTVDLTYNPSDDRYDLILGLRGNVYLASCK